MKTATKDTVRTTGEWQGMNWITQTKRLAIYLRDGMACAWCGAGIESGVQLTLDHLKPHSKGGSNHESNLVTCCKHCNTSRGTRGQRLFARAVATYVNHGVTADSIQGHIAVVTRRSLKPFILQSKELITQRGSAAKALAHFSQKGTK